MKCKGNFKFKGLTKRDAGVFKNTRGEEVSYNASYQLKLDETTENGIFERIFKIAVDSPLVKDLQIMKPYQDLALEFDVEIYSNRISLVPCAIIK